MNLTEIKNQIMYLISECETYQERIEVFRFIQSMWCMYCGELHPSDRWYCQCENDE